MQGQSRKFRICQSRRRKGTLKLLVVYDHHFFLQLLLTTSYQIYYIYFLECDVLINLLLVELQRQDDLNKKESRSKETRSDSVPLLTVYENVLKECKICFHFYQDKASKQPKWRDLTGSEKLRLFAKINISVLFPTIPNSADVQKLWADFLQLYKSLTSTTPVNHTEFQKNAAKWHRLFISVYQSKNVTPYTYLLSSHI